MSMRATRLPDLMPVLSTGKHRSPRKGACFMEFASYLAGERWSDHPACTHPLLAGVARLVNDNLTDERRQDLAELVPSVIGLTSDDLHVDARIALRCAVEALPVVATERQRPLAVSVLSCDRVLADLDGRPAAELEERSRWALARVPEATRWATRFSSGMSMSAHAFRRYAAPSTVIASVEGISQACVADPDTKLYNLLVGAIEDCAAFAEPAEPPQDRAPYREPGTVPPRTAEDSATAR
ncbi:MAG: hypothetical protein WCA46_29690 [Actinocatenispora sp.]